MASVCNHVWAVCELQWTSPYSRRAGGASTSVDNVCCQYRVKGIKFAINKRKTLVVVQKGTLG
jgi:hypothetical protein